jgi:hypothetical protein
MLDAYHLHTPQPRTEVDVAVTAIVAILDARIVPKTAGMIGRLSMATGAPVAEIKRVSKPMSLRIQLKCHDLAPTRRCRRTTV